VSIIVHPKYPEIIGVLSVQVLTGFNVHVTFTDGTERDIDLGPYLWGPVFEPIRNDHKLFTSVFVDPIGQTLAWPNEVDIAPEALYYDGEPPWAKDKPSIPGRRTTRSAPARVKRKIASRKRARTRA